MFLKSSSEIILFGLLIAALTYAIVKGGKQIIVMPSDSQPQQPQAPIIVQGGDDRYTRAPRPQRMWDVPRALEPIATRGPPDSYEQMGVLTAEGGKVLPLYGRRVAPRSDYFNYYTRTDTYNPVALPIIVGKRDCQEGVGCSEVFSGDSVKMSATGESAKVTLYGFETLVR